MAVLCAVGAYFVTPVVGTLAAFYLLAALVPLRPWGWTLALVAIAFAVPSVAIIAALPLLFMWTKPTTKAAFGRPPV